MARFRRDHPDRPLMIVEQSDPAGSLLRERVTGAYGQPGASGARMVPALFTAEGREFGEPEVRQALRKLADPVSQPLGARLH